MVWRDVIVVACHVIGGGDCGVAMMIGGGDCGVAMMIGGGDCGVAKIR